jgi:hypothetical protein
MTEREEYDAWVDANFDRARVPATSIEFGFETWKGGQQSLISASGAPVEIRVLGTDRR